MTELAQPMWGEDQKDKAGKGDSMKRQGEPG